MWCHASYMWVINPIFKCLCEEVFKLLILEILTNATLWYDQISLNYYKQVPKLIYEEHHSHFKGKWMTFPIYYYTVQRQGKENKKKIEWIWENVWPCIFQNKLLNIFSKIHFSTPLNTYIRWKDMSSWRLMQVNEANFHFYIDFIRGQYTTQPPQHS